jgi:exodeoxyribonuclease VII small subunit
MSVKTNVAKLEDILQNLEQEDTNIDNAVSQYKEAIDIAAKTMTELKKLEKNITQLKKESNTICEYSVDIN